MRKLTQGRWSRAFYFRLSALFSVNPFTVWETGKGYNDFKNYFDWLKVEKALSILLSWISHKTTRLKSLSGGPLANALLNA